MWQGLRRTLELLSFGDTLVLTCGTAAVSLPCPVPFRSSCCDAATSAVQRWEALVGGAHFTGGKTKSFPEDSSVTAQWQD